MLLALPKNLPHHRTSMPDTVTDSPYFPHAEAVLLIDERGIAKAFLSNAVSLFEAIVHPS